MNFELASTKKKKTKNPQSGKNYPSLRWQLKISFTLKASIVFCKICIINYFPWDTNYGNSGFDYYSYAIILLIQKHFTRKYISMASNRNVTPELDTKFTDFSFARKNRLSC